jgi:hypothetical protein
MNPNQEYTDPIKIFYVYDGGQEGKTTIQWFREVVCVSVGVVV